jgi:acyl transferase domain-containing protein
MSEPGSLHGTEIAIIGMTGRFPGARNLDEFWRNLRDGIESVRLLSDQELEALGVDAALRRDQNYVKATAVLDDVELFDAAFFGYTPRDAELMDPQQRIFLECAWEALENAGYGPETCTGAIGVFAGALLSTYLLYNLFPNRQFLSMVDPVQVTMSNSDDFLATRVSYNLNLKGPSCTVQTACSTSLVAVHLACQSLLNHECDVALAGGVSVNVNHPQGYHYAEGGMNSPDGHTRAFDAKASGTIFGNGVGAVVLKRLEDALADSDHIRAVIKGSAINNDGAVRVGYTAPSVEGQTAVIAEALTVAGVEADTIDYVETHGTATKMGDPIEIRALTEAFRSRATDKNSCAIGSVKTNIGHLAAAAGIASLIKTVLALENRLIPPSLHFEQPSPEIDFANSPFFVNTELVDWQADGKPRRAGVSSFGLGGTNAHVILEEAPAVEPSEASRPRHLLVLSAKTGSALDVATANLADYLKQHPDLDLADVAYTLQVGRQAFNYRRMVVCRDTNDAAVTLETRDPQRIFTAISEFQDRPVVFLFPGMGDQYVNMALGLYRSEPTFRKCVDHCAEFLTPLLGLDVRKVLYPDGTQTRDAVQELPASGGTPQRIDLRKILRRGGERPDDAAQQLSQTHLAHPILFLIEYALATLWMEWGIRPQAMIGHSIGEYVAACLAGVFSPEDGLFLITKRAQMIQELPGGAMLAVLLSEEEARPLLNENLSLSAVNAPFSCVISGPADAVADLERRFAEKGVAYQRLQTTHAFHSAMMAPIVKPFAELVKQVTLHPPKIPYLSNVTGTWVTAEEATDADYWARHLGQTVRFADGIGQLLREPVQILLEVGPGLTLSSLTAQRPDKAAEQVVLTSLRHPHDPQSDDAFLLTALGRLWLAGASVSWPGFYVHEQRHRLPLPTYPFERQRYWIGGQVQPSGWTTPDQLVRGKNPNITDWFFIPTWQQTPPLPPVDFKAHRWLVFVDGSGLGAAMVERLRALDQTVITVVVGEAFGQSENGTYTLNPQREDDYVALVRQLAAEEQLPDIVVHLWSITTGDTPSTLDFFGQMQDVGYYSLLFLQHALAREAPEQAAHIGVITDRVHDVSGSDRICPEKATLAGLCKVIPQEHANLACTCVDIVLPGTGTRQERQLVDCLVGELATETREVVLAYQTCRRWVQRYTPAPLREHDAVRRPLRERGVYWIIGGLGNVASLVAQHLARTVKARLILSSRSGLPPRSQWAAILTASDENDDIAKKIRYVQALEDLGAEVMVARADAADEAQMRDLVAQIYERWGELNGVVHIAGVTSGPSIHRPLAEMGRPESEMQFASKINALYVLEKALADRELDFCLLFSSSSAVLGGLGFGIYAAAHAFMDAFATSRSRISLVPWLSVDWDLWPIVLKPEQGVQSSFDQYAMTPEEAQEAFRRVACLAGEGQTLVMTGDLQARLDLWIRRTASERRQPVILHERPARAREYVAPRNDTEQTIAGVWTKVLGIEQIGIYDNFFELGGHSLLMTQVLSGLRQAFKIELPVRSLFEHTTVAGLAQFIESGGGQVSKEEEKPIAERIRTAFPTEREELVRTYLERKIALALGVEVDRLPEDGNLIEFDPEMFSVDLMVHLKQDFQIQVFPQEIRRIPSVEAMTRLVMSELDRVSDLARLATTNPLSAYTLQPYRKQSPGRPVLPTRKNRPMVFLACSPRSGSTLLRVMLAGHHGLFCPPELYLLHFETMQEWNQNVGFGDIFAWNRQGLEWAFSELLGVEPHASQVQVDELIDQNESVYGVYGHLQELADGRLLVDKTPTYALDAEALERAERLFEAPKYIHLVRHPYTVIESFLRARLDKLLGPNLFKESDVDPYVVAETVWTISNRTLLQFLARVEPERQRQVRYEDLVSDPATVMADLCQFLGVSFDEAVLNPYDNPLGRMTGGIGDPNIFRHKRISPERGEAWKKIKLPRYLDESTRQLAHQFGYELPGDDELSDAEVDRMLNELLEQGSIV